MGTILFQRMMLLFCVLIVVAACTNNSSVGVPVPSITATPTTDVILSPTPTIMLSPTATSTPILSPTYTPIPTATPDPAVMCQVLGEDGRIFVISDEELQEHYLHYKAKEALREAIRSHYPEWAKYSQQLSFDGITIVTQDLATIVWDAAPGCLEGKCLRPYSVNPSVILAVLILRYGEAPPPGFDAYQVVRQIVLDIKHFYEEGRAHSKVWQERFANISSYVMYEVMGQNVNQLQQWCVTYYTAYYTFSHIWQMRRP